MCTHPPDMSCTCAHIRMLHYDKSKQHHLKYKLPFIHFMLSSSTYVWKKRGFVPPVILAAAHARHATKKNIELHSALRTEFHGIHQLKLNLFACFAFTSHEIAERPCKYVPSPWWLCRLVAIPMDLIQYSSSAYVGKNHFS